MDAGKQLRAVSSLLDNYWLRNQVFRTAQFSSALLAGLLERPRPLWSDKLLKLSSSISNMRVMLRLLDDIPNLSHVLSSWHTVQEVSSFEKVVEGVCGQLYYPLEHVAWAADNQLIPLNSAPVWTLAILLWGIPLLLALLRKLSQLLTLYRQLQQAQDITSSPSTTTGGRAVGSLRQRILFLSLDLLQLCCDLGLAIFWMPSGFLWGGEVISYTVGDTGNNFLLNKFGISLQGRHHHQITMFCFVNIEFVLSIIKIPVTHCIE